MKTDSIGRRIWTRAAVAAALFAIAFLPLTFAGHAHLEDGQSRVGVESSDLAPAFCQLCRLSHERALPSSEANAGAEMARAGSAPRLTPPLPAAIHRSNQTTRAPPWTV